MSIQNLLENLDSYWWVLLIWFAFIPLFAWFYPKTHVVGVADQKPHRQVYSVVIFLTCIPGVFALILTLYSMIILRQNMLEVNIMVYFLPIISMIATLLLLRRRVKLRSIPLFRRLAGLMIILAVVFMLLFLLMNTRIFVLFGGSFFFLLLLGVGLFLLFWYGWKLMRKK